MADRMLGIVANRTLLYPTDPDIIARLQAGENIPMNQRGLKKVKAGERCDDLPEVSLNGFLAKGKVRRVREVANG